MMLQGASTDARKFLPPVRRSNSHCNASRERLCSASEQKPGCTNLLDHPTIKGKPLRNLGETDFALTVRMNVSVIMLVDAEGARIDYISHRWSGWKLLI